MLYDKTFVAKSIIFLNQVTIVVEPDNTWVHKNTSKLGFTQEKNKGQSHTSFGVNTKTTVYNKNLNYTTIFLFTNNLPGVL